MQKLSVILLLAIAIGGVYYNALGNGFVFDDYFMVLDNKAIRLAPQGWSKLVGLDGGARAYRPLRTLSYAADYRLGGLQPFVYHLLNIVYHWLATCLTFLVVLQIVVRKEDHLGLCTSKSALKIALCVALLWALHPVQTDAVTYISGRRDILAGLFFFLSFYAFLRLRTLESGLRTGRRWVWVGVAFLAFLLGALSKEVVFILPLVFFAYDLCQEHTLGQGLWRSVWRTYWRHKWLYLSCVFVATGALWYYAPYLSVILAWHGGGPLETWATVPRIWLHYLKLLLFPLTLNADYAGAFPLSSSFLAGPALAATLGVIVLVMAVFWALRQGYPLPAFCGLWWIITLLPVSHILPHHELVAEHYLYLPSFGFCLLVALGLDRLTKNPESRVLSLESRVLVEAFSSADSGLRTPDSRPWKAVAGYGLLAVLVTFYGARTVIRNQDWQDEETLWRKTVETAPGSARAHYNLGVVLKENGNMRGALQEFQRAATVDPSYGYSYTGMAEVYLQWMQLAEALASVQKGVELRPQWPWAHFVLGLVYFRVGDPYRAIPAFEQAITLSPDLLPAYQALAGLYQQIGEEEKAREWQRRLIQNGGGVPAFLFPGGEEKRAEEEEKEEGK